MADSCSTSPVRGFFALIKVNSMFERWNAPPLVFHLPSETRRQQHGAKGMQPEKPVTVEISKSGVTYFLVA